MFPPLNSQRYPHIPPTPHQYLTNTSPVSHRRHRAFSLTAKKPSLILHPEYALPPRFSPPKDICFYCPANMVRHLSACVYAPGGADPPHRAGQTSLSCSFCPLSARLYHLGGRAQSCSLAGGPAAHFLAATSCAPGGPVLKCSLADIRSAGAGAFCSNSRLFGRSCPRSPQKGPFLQFGNNLKYVKNV